MEIFIVWVVFIHFKQITHLKNKRLCNNHDYCHVEIPNRHNNTLKYNHGEKSLKVTWVIYVDFECLLIKQQLCQNNPEESYTEKKSIHESCSYSIDLVHLIQNKTRIVSIEEETVVKIFVKI